MQLIYMDNTKLVHIIAAKEMSYNSRQMCLSQTKWINNTTTIFNGHILWKHKLQINKRWINIQRQITRLTTKTKKIWSSFQIRDMNVVCKSDSNNSNNHAIFSKSGYELTEANLNCKKKHETRECSHRLIQRSNSIKYTRPIIA